jgi:hypothetical protein
VVSLLLFTDGEVAWTPEDAGVARLHQNVRVLVWFRYATVKCLFLPLHSVYPPSKINCCQSVVKLFFSSSLVICLLWGSKFSLYGENLDCSVVLWKVTNVYNEHTTFIFKVEGNVDKHLRKLHFVTTHNTVIQNFTCFTLIGWTHLQKEKGCGLSVFCLFLSVLSCL